MSVPSWSLNFINISNQSIPLQELWRMGATKRKTINLLVQSDTQWSSWIMNDSFISAQPQWWANQRIGVQTGLSGLRFTHSRMDKSHSQCTGRCWGTWRSSAESDSIWQCAFSPPYHLPHLRSCYPFMPLHASPNMPHFSLLLSFQWMKGACCLSWLSAPLLQERVQCDSGVNFSSETGCMCKLCQDFLAADRVACHGAMTVSNISLWVLQNLNVYTTLN